MLLQLFLLLIQTQLDQHLDQRIKMFLVFLLICNSFPISSQVSEISKSFLNVCFKRTAISALNLLALFGVLPIIFALY